MCILAHREFSVSPSSECDSQDLAVGAQGGKDGCTLVLASLNDVRVCGTNDCDCMTVECGWTHLPILLGEPNWPVL